MYKREQTLSYVCALRSIHLFSPLLKGGQFYAYVTAQTQNSVPRHFASCVSNKRDSLLLYVRQILASQNLRARSIRKERGEFCFRRGCYLQKIREWGHYDHDRPFESLREEREVTTNFASTLVRWSREEGD